MVQADQAAREPPLDRTTQRAASAPTVGVAAALALTRVVHPSQDRPHHVSTLLAQPHRGRPGGRLGKRQVSEEMRMVVIAAVLVVVALVVLAITSDR